MKRQDKILTSMQAAKILGITSTATIQNWLHGGYFPGASRTKEGQWRFKLSEVLDVKEAMNEVFRKNAVKYTTAGDFHEFTTEENEE